MRRLRGEFVKVVEERRERVLRLRIRFVGREANSSFRMTELMIASLVVMLICSTLSAAQGAGRSSSSATEQSLMASEKRLIEAMKKDDEEFFKRTVSEDFSLVGIDGKLLEKQEAIGDLGDSELVELTPYEMKVVGAGEGAAIVTYDAIVRRKPEEDQGPPPRYQHFSSVWVKQGDSWKLKFHQATSIHWGDW